MTQTAIRLTTRVLPGKRVEFTAPELTEGVDVDIFVALPQETAPPAAPTGDGRVSMVDFARTVIPGPRPFATWEEYEHALQEEKDAWER